jgi:hypothetical protein
MSSLKLKTPSGGSVSFNATDTASDVTLTVPASNASIITSADSKTVTHSMIETTPAFGVYATAAQTNDGISNGAKLIEWGGVSVDTTSSFDLTNNKYVIPITGTYFFTTTISWQTTSISGRYVRSTMNNNGNTFAGIHTHISNESGDDDYISGTISYIANFTIGDEVTVTWGTVTTGEVRIMTGGRSTTFSGHLIGKV